MIFKKPTFLGLVLGEHSFVIAEISLRGKSFEVRQVTEWLLPDGVSDAESIGRALQQFLHSRRISSSLAVIGIPAKWLLTKEKKIPPVDAETLTNLLKLESEKDFSLPPEELVLDYIKSVNTVGDNDSLLLLATNKNKVNFVCQMARKAGLKIIAITPTSLSLISQFSVPNYFIGLYMGREAAELIMYSDGIPFIIKHIGIPESTPEGSVGETSKSWISAVSSEIQRLLMLLPRHENFTEPSEIIVWDDYGLTKLQLETFKTLIPLPVKIAEPVYSRKEADIGDNASVPCNGSVALAKYARYAKSIPVNFLHSHMVIQKKFKWQRTLVRSAIIFVLIVFAIVIGITSLHNKETEVKKLREQMNSLEPELNIASAVLDYTASMSGWKGEKMVFLECLREITIAFPIEGKIWVTSMAIRDDMRGLVSGKSVESKAVLELIDKLKQNKSFSDVNLLYIRHAGGDSKDIVYAVNFVFSQEAESDTTVRRNNL